MGGGKNTSNSFGLFELFCFFFCKVKLVCLFLFQRGEINASYLDFLSSVPVGIGKIRKKHLEMCLFVPLLGVFARLLLAVEVFTDNCME